MTPDEAAKWRELRKALANDSERRIHAWEKPVSPQAAAAVASLIGRIRLEWHLQEKAREDYWKWL